jgi:hypothetical protein
MTGTVCSFHISAVDHLLSGNPLFSGAVVCSSLRRSLGAVLPFSSESDFSISVKSVGCGWLGKIKRNTHYMGCSES